MVTDHDHRGHRVARHSTAVPRRVHGGGAGHVGPRGRAADRVLGPGPHGPVRAARGAGGDGGDGERVGVGHPGRVPRPVARHRVRTRPRRRLPRGLPGLRRALRRHGVPGLLPRRGAVARRARAPAPPLPLLLPLLHGQPAARPALPGPPGPGLPLPRAPPERPRRPGPRRARQPLGPARARPPREPPLLRHPGNDPVPHPPPDARPQLQPPRRARAPLQQVLPTPQHPRPQPQRAAGPRAVQPRPVPVPAQDRPQPEPPLRHDPRRDRRPAGPHAAGPQPQRAVWPDPAGDRPPLLAAVADPQRQPDAALHDPRRFLLRAEIADHARALRDGPGRIDPGIHRGAERAACAASGQQPVHRRDPASLRRLERASEVRVDGNRLVGPIPFGKEMMWRLGKKLRVGGNEALCYDAKQEGLEGVVALAGVADCGSVRSRTTQHLVWSNSTVVGGRGGAVGRMTTTSPAAASGGRNFGAACVFVALHLAWFLALYL
ncbi:hypothetical protein PR202_gb05490 [Eleusine coracana subsp. coracana]|uniref:Uncharacterized protein n=1 Tax=Eleusine coracana subsp. coracana TaxID=191504 RepID=A0AAV5E5H8_ELECO|nr:hypothetical protein PR202_gb05490 [Eleusine coracana subsp. coracana]